MKRFVVLAGFIFFTAGYAGAQTAADSIKTTIDKMFRLMKEADGMQMLTSCFADSAIMQTIIKDKDGNNQVKSYPINEFAKLIGTMTAGMADERITYDLVKVDGPLAVVLTPYKFYLNGQFSHCGTNSFQLVRVKAGWRIQYIIDTRRRQGCE